MEPQRYQVTQDNLDYILSTSINGNKIRIDCQDNNIASTPIYGRDYSLTELRSYSNIFEYTQSVLDVQNEINNAIERHQVRITNQGNIIELVIELVINTFDQELTFQLPIANGINIVQNIPVTTLVTQPVALQTFQTVENDFPDCTYSTKGPEIYQVTQQQIGCGCPMDHDRIDKIEYDANLMKSEHDVLKQRLSDLKMKIQMMKKRANDIRTENGMLNMKTLELKKIYKDLLEAEAALRAENDELRKENHELMLKKNELGFYTVEHHDHDTVKEVNIPYEHKSRRPTNVSKREKQFGGGYTSTSINNNNQLDQPYSSANLGRVNGNSGNKGYSSSGSNRSYY